MNEVIAEMVADESHVVGAKHTEFCQLVTKICQDACREDAYYRTLDKTSPDWEHWEMQVPSGSNDWFCYTEVKGCDGYLYVCYNDAPPARKAIDMLKDMIDEHLGKVCLLIQEHMIKPLSVNEVWNAYEIIFCNALNLNDSLIPLFECAYYNRTELLKTRACDLTVEALKIRETWILDMLVKPRDVGIWLKKETEELSLDTQVMDSYLMMPHRTKKNLSCDDQSSADSSEDDCDQMKNSETYSGGGTSCFEYQTLHGVSVKAETQRFQNCSSYVQPTNSPDTDNDDSWVILNVPGAPSIALDDDHEDITTIPSCDRCRCQFYSSSKSSASFKDSRAWLSKGNSCPDEVNRSLSKKHVASEMCCDKARISGIKRKDQFHNSIQSKPGVQLDCVAPEKSMKFCVESEKFKHVFGTAYHCLTSLGDENTPLKKMQTLTRCLRAITTALAKPETSGCHSAPCADQLVTVLVVLLLNLTPDQISRLYVQLEVLKLTVDLMTHSLLSGEHSYSVTQLEVAYEYVLTNLTDRES